MGPRQYEKPERLISVMHTCPKCKAIVLVDSTFCEACGWRLDQPVAPAETEEVAPASAETYPEVQAPNGSLRNKISLLSGATRQLHARWQNIRKKNNPQPSSSENNDNKKERRQSKVSIFVSILTGLSILAVWIWLLTKKVGSAALYCAKGWLSR